MTRKEKIAALRLKISVWRAELDQQTVREAILLPDGRILVTVAPPPHLAHMEALD